ncbi:MAG TPA: riboflavin synthase [Gemmatimonadaceae bacterium]|nr:riboflavin synthase [Gemmatimonadaceae bacterium]
MFTGLVDAIGSIRSVGPIAAGIEVWVDAPYEGLERGESIAVNGVCLTVRDIDDRGFSVAAVVTTAGRTTVGEWQQGGELNLERAMRADSRFGGHIVQGHVDDVGVVRAVETRADALLIDIDLPAGLSETLVPHGSVAIDGVSLTVNDVEGDKLQISLVDYTLRHTTLGRLSVGDRVNIETDVIGKYVRRISAPYVNR